MTEYTLRKTRRGDYIIRDQAGRERARLATEPEAKQWIENQQATNAQEAASLRAAVVQQELYDASLPDLRDQQLRWQIWRNWFYNELRHKDRQLIQARRFLDNAPNPDSPTYHNHEQNLTKLELDQNAAWELYERAVTLDTRIKTSRREKNATALTEALTEAMGMVGEMDKFFLHIARPERPKRTSGTAPNTSLHLSDEQRQWLVEQGGIQPTIRRLIDEGRSSQHVEQQHEQSH